MGQKIRFALNTQRAFLLNKVTLEAAAVLLGGGESSLQYLSCSHVVVADRAGLREARIMHARYATFISWPWVSYELSAGVDSRLLRYVYVQGK